MKLLSSKLAKNISLFVDQIENSIHEKRVKRLPSRNVHNVLWERAIQDSANFIENYLDSVMLFRSKKQMFDFVISKLSEKNIGFCLEFGVASGYSINYFSEKLPSANFIGFDSFEGLPEDWIGHHAKKGSYTQKNQKPKVNNNVHLIEGWFEDTLPKFLDEQRPLNLSFIHIDSDTYSSAYTILKYLHKNGLLKNGTFILFDEFLGYPNWKNGEYKALAEFSKSFEFEYLAFTSEQALIKIK